MLKPSYSTRRSAFFLAASAALIIGALPAEAAEKGKEGKTKKPMVFQSKFISRPSPTGSAMGAVAEALRANAGRPSPEVSDESARMLERALRLNRSSEGLKAVAGPGRVVSMNLEGRYLHITLERKNPDGTTSTACVTDWDSARAFLEGGAAPGESAR